MAIVAMRENTFKVDFTNFERRPSFEDVHNFVFHSVGLRTDQVKRLQMNHIQCCAHVKCIDLQTAQNAVEQHNDRHELEVNGKKYKVHLMMDDQRIEIKIHDLSENISNANIASYLRKYGDVHSVREVIWGNKFAGKGISSGVRVARMTLRQHIKSFVTVQGEQTLVTYPNQPQTCRHCTNALHPGKTCVENKKWLGQNSKKSDDNKPTQNKISTEVSPAGTIPLPSPVVQKAAIQTNTQRQRTSIQEKQQQQSKRSARQTSPIETKSPPRKKTDREQAAVTTPEIQSDQCESEKEDSDMETVSSEDTEDVDKWLERKIKKMHPVKRSLNKE